MCSTGAPSSVPALEFDLFLNVHNDFSYFIIFDNDIVVNIIFIKEIQIFFRICLKFFPFCGLV